MERDTSEQMQLFVPHADESEIDKKASQSAMDLAVLTTSLGYEADRRTAHVEKFMHRTLRTLKRNEVSTEDYMAHALALLKNNMIDESDLEKFYASSSLYALKKTLLLVEALVDNEEPDPEHEDELEDIMPLFVLSDVVARELSYRGEEKFVDLHYSGVDFQTEATKE